MTSITLRILICYFVSLSVCANVFAQVKPKQILGSFIFKNQAYNYEFEKQGEDRFSFVINSPSDHGKTASNESKDSTEEADAKAKKLLTPKPDSVRAADSANALATVDSLRLVVNALLLNTTRLVDSTQQADSIRFAQAIAANDTTEHSQTGSSARIDSIQAEITGVNDSFAYVFSEFTQDVFTAVFTSQMKAKYNLTGASLANTATGIYFKILTRLEFKDDEPVTAYAVLRYQKIYSYLLSNTSVYYRKWLSRLIVPLYVDNVSIETYNGSIKNITATVFDTAVSKNMSVSGRSMEFKNLYPITISGKFDPEKFPKIKLFCFNCYGIKGLTRYINLGDLMGLKIVYETDKEDYSPANGVFSLSPTNSILELKKEKRSRIIQVSAFTDLVGLDQQQPNGLIQIEASRKINLNTISKLIYDPQKKRKILLSSVDLTKKIAIRADSTKISEDEKETKFLIYSLPLKAGDTPVDSITISNTKFYPAYQTWFNYVEPKLLFSKIEQFNKIIDSSKAPGNKISPLTLYQYQIASFGLNLQVLRLNFPQLKFQWNVLTVGAQWARSRVATTPDSTGPSDALNSLNYELKTSVDFFPDNRWGASIGFSYLKQNLWNSAYQLSNNKALLQFQFDGFLKTNDYDKLFFRFRWTYQAGEHNTNYTQIQLGYSLYLFGASTSADSKSK